MRILFCNAPSVALMGDCGGVLREMRLREESLRFLGHEVDYISLWETPDWSEYDLCHLFMANGASFDIGAAAKRHLPLVVSPIIDQLHSNAMLRLNIWLDRHFPVVFTHAGRSAALCQMADMVCLRSREEKDRLLHGFGVTSACAIAICPIVVESAEPDEGRFAEYANKPYVFFLGDAGNPRKNVERLIQAVRNLEVDLLIGGMVSGGTTGRSVSALAEKTPNVRLIGLVSEGEKAFLLEHARAFVLPSLMEGIGLAAAEAALAGTTVVITKKGGPPDYFGDHAYYVSPRSVSDIRNKIKKALASPLDASSQIQQICTLEATGIDLETCYQKCIDLERA